jgi:ParB-like chromosome segregation protein Spo0J
VVVCRRQERYELIDGFKRLGAARNLSHIPHLSARLLEADERTAKAAIYGLNRAGGRTRELEEAWIIQALVREDGMSQVEVAELLGRHKSPDQAAAGSIEPESHLAPANGINNLQMPFWRVGCAGGWR